jgi:hypothetical protein
MTNKTGEKMNSAEPSLTPRRVSLERVFFAGCLVVFLAAHLAIVGSAMAKRALPLTIQDAYSYIIKAAQMGDCFLQNRPALNDLREQLTPPSADEEVALMRYRQRQRVFSIYCPLHSALLAAIHRLGLTWEASYSLVQLAGIIFVGGAVGFLLLVLWGPMAGGIALLFLAATAFSDHGFYFIVPHNLAMAIAMLAWGHIARNANPRIGEVKLADAFFRDGDPRQRSPRVWILLLAIVVMLAMHAAGRIYALVTLALYWLLAGHVPWRKRALVSVVTVLLIAIPSLLPVLVTRPDFALLHDPVPPQWSRMQAVAQTALAIPRKMTFWIGLDKSNLRYAVLVVPALAALLAAGFVAAPRDRRRKALLTAVPLALIPFTDVLFTHPRYPGLLFSRLWVSIAVLATGAFGQAVVALTQSLVRRDCRRRLFGKPFSGAPSSNHGPAISPSPFCRPMVFFPLALALVVYVGLAAPGKIGRVQQAYGNMLYTSNVAFDRAQPRELPESARPGDRVLYTQEVVLLFYLTHAGFNLGAVYSPAVVNTPEEAFWLSPDRNIRFVAALNPLVWLPLRRHSGLSLPAGERLEIRSGPPRSAASFHLRLANRSAIDGVLRVSEVDSEGQPSAVSEIALRARSDEWRRVDLAGSSVTQLRLETPAGKPAVSLSGIRVDPTSTLQWPWDSGVSVVYAPSASATSPTVVSFDSAALHPRPGHTIEVLSDTGATVLARIVK